MKPIDEMTTTEMATELESLRKRNEELELALLTIGDMAVVDWDDGVVGEVDKVTSKTYMDKYVACKRNVEKMSDENSKHEQEMIDLADYYIKILNKHGIVLPPSDMPDDEDPPLL